MYNDDTELLFPIRAIPILKDLRGKEWADLVMEVSAQGDQSLPKVAFESLMVKLSGCGVCDADSFRAMRGCSQCAMQTIRRFKGTDQDLIRMYMNAKKK